MSTRNRAKIGYDAYVKAVGGKAFNGDDLPPFERLPERIAAAWAITADAIEDAVLEERR